ncbi:hypothetical protein VV02_25430 [Luteipulveratus mongoliensis]|uniref:Uncharacterized protein n=1 Tax=Luteipulveratus mongoliensis TaxID=571913 RepID=A0A0K1JRV4_9MICO|nr:hypothetical protein VV02_25430 [Luteipulveratus mongoliensis]
MTRLAFALGHHPTFRPIPDDVLLPGWPMVALCVAAGAVGVRLGRLERHHRPTLVVAGVVGAALVAESILLLLDLVSVLSLGTFLPVYAVSATSRLGCLAGGLLVLGLARTTSRLVSEGCPSCDREGSVDHWSALRSGPVPRRAWVAAHLAVAGMVARVVGQLAIGLDTGPQGENGTNPLLFEGGFLLAGSVLPLAMVYGWGRVWPRWVLPLRGRTVQRWLVAGPGLVLSAGITIYFGICLVQMTIEQITTGRPYGDTTIPDAFFWVAVPAYLVWGVAMGFAAVSYYQRTRPPCRHCQR